MFNPVEVYNVLAQALFTIPPIVLPPYFLINAPFGRFSPDTPSALVVDGIKSWIVMELVSPLTCIGAFLSSTLTRPLSSLKRFPLSPPNIFNTVTFFGTRISVPNPPTLLLLLFLTHYANRALISPLRTPVRSKSHLIVPLCGISFNLLNGSLMGAFLSALASTSGKSGNPSLVADWKFWLGVGMWIAGFASNIWHDEILLNIRRKPKGNSTSQNQSKGEKKSEEEKPHYAIPYGGLYSLISYPNYTSEWFEWLGFAIASSALTSQLPLSHVVFAFAPGRVNLGPLSQIPFIQRMTPPWIFFFSELFLMFPRAWNGHKWYHKKFPDYPRERKIVIPFLL
ncbi:hypothetical protein M422DRAFT_223830 [Sphaerobolus stellatus SS14]|nr:hypothetical protein M422DRAFT_223830 [Sphaerobolus stellatus SS14]